MKYELEIGELNIRQINDLYLAVKQAAKWANHGATCRGYLGYATNESGDKIPYDKIPQDEKHLWWQAFDEKQCTCGIKAIRCVLWSDRLKKHYYSTTKPRAYVPFQPSPDDLIDTLREEIQTLRQGLEDQTVLREKSDETIRKLERKLSQILSAATVKPEASND